MTEQSVKLVRYDAARAALEKAWQVDEVKAIQGQAAAVKAYAKQVNDREMQSWAQEIYIPAEAFDGTHVQNRRIYPHFTYLHCGG